VDLLASAGAWAQNLRDVARAEMNAYGGGNVHLFFACPNAVALFLGHRWNRVAPTLTYEDLNDGPVNDDRNRERVMVETGSTLVV
jgi:SMODS-associated and fused to various effectors sensor domain